ncbi:MAG: hypothetical protein AAF662_03455 [Pseudomonadota bacterium]
MKIHVVLKDSAQAEIEEMSPESFTQYVQKMRLSNVNVDRVKRFGVLTGDIDDPKWIAALERDSDVEAVEVDRVKSAT